jgi:hypothetical protein
MRKSVLIKISVLILLIAIVMLGFKVSDQQEQLQTFEKQIVEQSNLLTGNNAAPGYSCGALTFQRAKELLKSNSKLKRSFGQGLVNTVRATKTPQENLFWSDSCRYEDSGDSAKYIEMYVATFQSEESAVQAFPDFLEVVNEAVELPSEEYGQKLFYDGGAFYLLKENRVIQIAANNGSLQQLDSFSRLVFENVLKSL